MEGLLLISIKWVIGRRPLSAEEFHYGSTLCLHFIFLGCSLFAAGKTSNPSSLLLLKELFELKEKKKEE